MDATRLRRTILPVSLLSFLFLFVFACVPKPITDLRPVGISRVPAAELPPSNDLRNFLTKRGEAVWKVSLVGDANWIHEVKRHELNSYATVVRCDDRDKSLFSLGPYVGKVPISYYGEGFDHYQPPLGVVTYDIYLPEFSSYRSEADFNAPMPDYNLARLRMTLCIRIAGGAMTGASGRSNEVRVEVGSHT